MGVPSVFLRLATCNLTCHWCDTKYTWDWRNFDYQTEVMELDPEAIKGLIQAFNCSHVVITGGEPLLQQAELEPLVESLADDGHTFEVETNGTIVPTPVMVKHVGQYGPHAAAKRAGFHKGDIILAFDGRDDLLRDGDLLAYAVNNRQPGERVKVDVLRGDKRLQLTLPMQK